jgi:hemerythrin superfamily protein
LRDVERFQYGTLLAMWSSGRVIVRHTVGGSEDAMEASATVERGFESVTAYLAHDHHRLDEALRSASSAVTSGRFVEATAGYERFESDLLRHLRVEEELIFPVFEARSGLMNGPTDAMRNEHRQVRLALAHMRRGVLHSDAAAFGDGLRFFESVLPDHNAKEEHILYPALDSLLRPVERAALVARLQREFSR